MSRLPATAARRRTGALLLVGVLALGPGVAACGGSGSSGGEATPPTTIPDDFVVATDPALPIQVEVGHRFAIVLPADPGEGWRWVVQPFDTTKLVALGSGFSDDEKERAASTAATSTTSTTLAARATATSTTTTTNPDAPTTTTTAMPPLVQMVSFAGRAPGTASITFRAARIVETTPSSPVVVKWSVEIVPARTAR